MAVFFLLPPRPSFEAALARFLAGWTPGLAIDDLAVVLTDTLQAVLNHQSEAFVVFREELPDGQISSNSLRDTLGAESGDRIVEVRLTATSGEPRSISWRLDEAAAA